jgi:hypothetical protein
VAVSGAGAFEELKEAVERELRNRGTERARGKQAEIRRREARVVRKKIEASNLLPRGQACQLAENLCTIISDACRREGVGQRVTRTRIIDEAKMLDNSGKPGILYTYTVDPIEGGRIARASA